VDRWIRTTDDVLDMLDRWFTSGTGQRADDGAGWWDEFYADRSKPVPFFADKPDENLVSWVSAGRVGSAPMGPGRVLELGCGPGRNAIWLAGAGFTVDAVDLSPVAVAWAGERAAEAGVSVRFVCGDMFSMPPVLASGRYDLVYDSGCFHHLPPHRRVSYLALIERALAPGGLLGLTCFAAGQMGCELPDEQLYRDGQLHGGLAYSPDALRQIFAGFDDVELRPMAAQPADGSEFGVSFLLAALFRQRASGGPDAGGLGS
jgi:SAM-dependent methyltransferase